MTTDACTMPTAERPLRLAELDALFAASVRSVTRSGVDVRLELEGDSGLRERVQDLARREVACCSFFTFVVEGGSDRVVLSVSVPAERREILDALADRAEKLGA